MAHLHGLITQSSIMISVQHCERIMGHSDIIIMNCDFKVEHCNTIMSQLDVQISMLKIKLNTVIAHWEIIMFSRSILLFFFNHLHIAT